MMGHWIIAPVVLPAVTGAFTLLALRDAPMVARELARTRS